MLLQLHELRGVQNVPVLVTRPVQSTNIIEQSSLTEQSWSIKLRRESPCITATQQPSLVPKMLREAKRSVRKMSKDSINPQKLHFPFSTNQFSKGIIAGGHTLHFQTAMQMFLTENKHLASRKHHCQRFYSCFSISLCFVACNFQMTCQSTQRSPRHWCNLGYLR